MKTLKVIVLFCLISPLNIIFAQNIGINSTGAIPHASSLLDITSANKGVLIPRINITDLATDAPVTAPAATSLLVYNTNTITGVGFYFWNGTEWIKLTDSSGNADEDWYEVSTTSDPNNINDNIFSMGKVGIGLNNPITTLHISGGTGPGIITIDADSDADSDSDQAYILMKQDAEAVQAHAGFGGTEGNGDFFRIGIKSSGDATINYSNFVIDGDWDRVGILANIPTATLTVNGTANKPGSSAWIVISDQNLKKEISDYQEGLTLITQVKAHNFKYNDTYDQIFGKNPAIKNKEYRGVMAQELQLIAPDMVDSVEVNYKNETGELITKNILQVDPNKFTYALINATQEQQIIIEEQAAKISALENRLIAIEAAIKK
jgi:hypothetical protein